MYSYKYLININIEYITIIYVILRLYNSLFNQKDGLILSSKSFGREEREERRGEGREPSPICYECFRKELEQTKWTSSRVIYHDTNHIQCKVSEEW